MYETLRNTVRSFTRLQKATILKKGGDATAFMSRAAVDFRAYFHHSQDSSFLLLSPDRVTETSSCRVSKKHSSSSSFFNLTHKVHSSLHENEQD